MHEHASGLIDDEQVGVFEKDVERQRLGNHGRTASLIDPDLNKIVCAKAIADVLIAAVDLASFAADKVAQVHFADSRKLVKQMVLEPPVCGGRGYYELKPAIHTDKIVADDWAN